MIHALGSLVPLALSFLGSSLQGNLGSASRAPGAMLSGFSWFQLLPGFGHDASVGQALGLHEPHEAFLIPTSWAVVGVLLVLAGAARMGLNAALAREGNAKYVPDGSLTIRNLFEVVVEWLWGMTEANVGHKEGKTFFPLIATLFLYVVASNLLGFIPGMLPPTENISNNLAMAATVFLVFNYAGLSRDAVGYVKHLAGPILLLAPVFLVLETVSLCIRPISLSVRLTVNIVVDHILQLVARGLGSDFLGMVGGVLLPVPLYFLGLLVCVVQAFIFALLTSIYIGLALPHADEHHH